MKILEFLGIQLTYKTYNMHKNSPIRAWIVLVKTLFEPRIRCWICGMDQIFKNSNHSMLTLKIWALRPNGVKISFGARITLHITYQTFSFRDPCRYLLFECEWPSWNNIKNKNKSIFWIIWSQNDFFVKSEFRLDRQMLF